MKADKGQGRDADAPTTLVRPEDETLEQAAERFKQLSWIPEFAEGSDRVCAIVGAAVLEETVGMLVRGYLADDKVSRDLLAGPLQPFGAQVKVAYAVGLLSAPERSDLLTIAKIRNQFAHNHAIVSFNDGVFAKFWPQLQLVEQMEKGMGKPWPDNRGRFILTVGPLQGVLLGRLEIVERRTIASPAAYMSGPLSRAIAREAAVVLPAASGKESM